MRTIQMKSKMRSKLRWKGREADLRLIREPPGSEQIGLFCCGLPLSVAFWPRFPHGQRWAVVLAKVWLLAGTIVPDQSLISLSPLTSQPRSHLIVLLCSFPFKYLVLSLLAIPDEELLQYTRKFVLFSLFFHVVRRVKPFNMPLLQQSNLHRHFVG